MLQLNLTKSGIAAVSALLVGVILASPLVPLTSALAQPFPNNSNGVNKVNSTIIPRGNLIPVRYDSAQEIQVKLNQYLPLDLQVAVNIQDHNGNVLIPAGSKIVGQIEPAQNGSQYVAWEIILPDGQLLPLNAVSHVISTTQTVTEGADISDILTGTFTGAGAATIIAGTTGDRHIHALEVLGGAALGTLAGWGLPEGQILGGDVYDVITINPNRDLTLTLLSDL